MQEVSQPGGKTVSELVNELFDTHRHESGRQYTNKEVELALKGEVSQAYLSKLRLGQIHNPGRNHLLLLCRFFGVPASYFFPELALLPDDKHNEDHLYAALRSYGLNAEARHYLVKLAAILRNKEDEDE